MAPAEDDPTVPAHVPSRRRQVVQTVITTVVVVLVFGFVLPQLADYEAVLDYITNVEPIEWLLLGALAVGVLLAYMLVLKAAMRSLRFTEAYVAQTTAQAINNALPAGGAIALPLQYAMYMSWGFTPEAVTSMFLAVGIWDQFARFGIPIAALAIGAVTQDTDWWMWAVAAGGIVLIVVWIWLLHLVFSNENAARRVGDFFERVVNRLARSPFAVSDAVMQFRANSIDVVQRRWRRITLTTLVNHAAQAALFLGSIRAIGIAEGEIPTVWVVASFALGRLLTMIPVSPGGLGLVDLGWIGLLSAGWQTGTPDTALIAAGTLLFRALTYLPPIPLGVVSWVVYRVKRDWRRPWREARRGEWARLGSRARNG